MKAFLTLICSKASEDVDHGMNDRTELIVKGREGKETMHKVKIYLKDINELKQRGSNSPCPKNLRECVWS